MFASITPLLLDRHLRLQWSPVTEPKSHLEEKTKYYGKEVDTQYIEPHQETEAVIHPLVPPMPYIQEQLWVVGDNAIKSMSNIPSHSSFLVHRPSENWPLVALRFTNESTTPGGHQHRLQHVEGDIGDLEEMRRVEE